MNTQAFKPLFLAVIGAAFLWSSSPEALAQASGNNTSGLSSNAAAKIQGLQPFSQQLGGQPSNLWPYKPAAINTTALPTIDFYGANYLPYLPWMGSNLALLVEYADFFYRQQQNDLTGKGAPYDEATTAAANIALIERTKKTASDAGAATASGVTSTLSQVQSVASSNRLIDIPGSDTAFPSKNSTPPDNAAFNADTLFAKDGYPASENDSTITPLLDFLAGLTQPLPNIHLGSNEAERKTMLGRSDIQQYVLTVRAMAAAQSMALSNLNYLAQERQIVQGLGDTAGMTEFKNPGDPGKKPNKIPDASQLQLEKFLVDRRAGNPDWYTAVNNASSTALQRETLFLLAEMQQQVYQLRMVNERLLATMSVMQMQMVQFNKANLVYLKNTISSNSQQTGQSGTQSTNAAP